MNAKRAAGLMNIARYYGKDHQLAKLMEEMGEATSAASEVLQLVTFYDDGGKEDQLENRLIHLAEELADVANVTEQILFLFGLEVEFKVARHAGVQKTLRRIRQECRESELLGFDELNTDEIFGEVNLDAEDAADE